MLKKTDRDKILAFEM